MCFEIDKLDYVYFIKKIILKYFYYYIINNLTLNNEMNCVLFIFYY